MIGVLVWCTRMGTRQGAITRRLEYRLFDADALGLTAFICSPLAGTILMAVNYGRLRKVAKEFSP
jgi:hypothetical protein